MSAPAAVRQRARKEKLQQDLKEAANQRLVDQQASNVGIQQLKQKYRTKMLLEAMETFDGNITPAQRAALEAQANEPIAAQAARGPRKPPKVNLLDFGGVAWRGTAWREVPRARKDETSRTIACMQQPHV